MRAEVTFRVFRLESCGYDRGVAPRARRWTRDLVEEEPRLRGCSACAEMDRTPARSAPIPTWLLRVRGDGPSSLSQWAMPNGVAPRARRWTFVDEEFAPFPAGCSACVEMDPEKSHPMIFRNQFLRVRGDEPQPLSKFGDPSKAPPHMRRSTIAPALAPSLDRGSSAYAETDGSASATRYPPPESLHPSPNSKNKMPAEAGIEERSSALIKPARRSCCSWKD